MFHAWFYPLSCVLSTLWSTFHMISWTNLLTRATVPAACFLLFLVPGKSENEYSRNWTGQTSKSITFRGEQEVQRGDGEACQGSQTPLERPGVGPRLGRVWPPWSPPGLASSPIRSPRCRNAEYPIKYP